ncbi:OLC1v1005877C1 [Oldenlandia corymbosa var. corymbosa]|uniref:OLC1v1005877C1 n=1 Tax=Oldenlandia corymbosa var. corymbosa TaxID=529605 RepID=A0AAV1DG51_OLDCO|nr:OLC1v1005877C1 [Oldenlandia corymbosa var. corymbosa]
MEKRLNDAAIRGDIVALSQLVEEDLHIFDRIYLNCDDKNVLHISAMLGHEEFVRAILQMNSSSHYQMCLVRDRNGRNPLHLAAIHGKLNILNLVNDHDGLMQAAQEKADEGGTILHLCVKYNQLEALKFLLRVFADSEFGRREIILHLINNTSQIVNIKNVNRKTALDIYREKQFEIPPVQFQQIVDSILKVGGKSGYVGSNGETEHVDDIDDEDEFVTLKLVEKGKDVIMVVASIIATMASQAMVNLPRGVNCQDDLSSEVPYIINKAGKCVKKQTDPENFKNTGINKLASGSTKPVDRNRTRGSWNSGNLDPPERCPVRKFCFSFVGRELHKAVFVGN